MTARLMDVVDDCGGRLVDDGPASRWLNREIVDVTHDSRQVERGWLYCCVPGATVDGHDFADQAVERGAVALMVERPLETVAGPDVPQIMVERTRWAMGPAAAAVHGNPSDKLITIGVTGTNGKSSTVQLVADIYTSAGLKSEVVGTIKGARTTPESTDLQRLLAQAVGNGVAMVAIEVSSHALDMGRVKGTTFDAALFTNLGRDHLDYHRTMEAYFEAKARLFLDGYTTLGVINLDDHFGRRLADLARPILDRVVGYSLADATEVEFRGATSRFVWRGRRVVLGLAGTHNLSNALGAATVAVELGIDPEEVIDALAATRPVRGRFEMVEGGQPFHLAVDYAHTPDALNAALATARQVAGSGRVLATFGCGGDRDVHKRPEMGQIAEKGADVVVITSDNPRSEDPLAIIDQIVAGFDRPDRVMVEPDRRAAITRVVSLAQPGDVVLIAGKGHETYQITGDVTVEFDDHREALEAIGRLEVGR